MTGKEWYYKAVEERQVIMMFYSYKKVMWDSFSHAEGGGEHKKFLVVLT